LSYYSYRKLGGPGETGTMSRLFKRNNKTTIAELEEYYANQENKKTRNGKAWFMAFLSLFITLAVIAMIFFGGRWLYRVLTDDKSNNTTTSDTTKNDGVDLPNFDGDIVGQGNQKGSNDKSSSQTGNGTVTDEAASTSIPNTDRVTTVAGSDQEEVPNTGAGEIILLVPFVFAIVGYFVSRKHMIKNS